MDFDENAIAELFYTSGSTGTPKGVMLSQAACTCTPCGLATFYKDDSAVDLTPSRWSMQRLGTPAAATETDTSMYLLRRSNPPPCGPDVSRARTSMSLDPTMAVALLNSP